VSRKYDVWSMGCMVLEFVTWLLLGAERVDAFSRERLERVPQMINGHVEYIDDDTFFTKLRNGRDAIIRRGVAQWVDKLRADKQCSQLIHDVLGLVMDRMLQVDQDLRATSEFLRDEMESIHQRARDNRRYRLDPVPRSIPARPSPSRTPTPSSTGHNVRFADINEPD
jgi:serine/threonine protein kinase